MEQVKFNPCRILDIKPFAERVEHERLTRQKNALDPLFYDIQYLDEASQGITRYELVIFAGPPGQGKTELATHTAMSMAKRGKRVAYFALEAAENEIERRVRFKILSNLVFKRYENRPKPFYWDYLTWVRGHLDQYVGDLDKELDAELKLMFPTFRTFYRLSGDYTIDDFERQFLGIQSEIDAVFVDHLHYFDSDDENDLRAVKRIVKKLRDLALMSGKPVFLVSHIRKSDRKNRSLCPELDDLHGTSDIGKIGTQVVTISSAMSVVKPERSTHFPTFMRLTKFREGGSRTNYVAITAFDTELNAYSKGYMLGRLSYDGSKFEPFTSTAEMPYWAKNAIVGDINA